MPPKFRPKQPKARKAKTSEQKAVIAGRQAKEDRRGDDIKRAQQRSFALRKDPQSFLTGMGDMATAYTTTAMAKVNTTRVRVQVYSSLNQETLNLSLVKKEHEWVIDNHFIMKD